MDLQVEVAWRAAVRPRTPLAAQPQPLAVGGAGRNARGEAAAVELHRALGAAESFFKREAPGDFVILARESHGRTAAGAAAPAEAGCAAEGAKGFEQVAKVHPAQILAAAAAEALEPVGRRAEILPRPEAAAQAVVGGALFLVAQGFVRLGDLLEFLLGVGFLRDVGMVLARELAVGLLDLVLARRAGHPEDLVVILVFHNRVR